MRVVTIAPVLAIVILASVLAVPRGTARLRQVAHHYSTIARRSGKPGKPGQEPATSDDRRGKERDLGSREVEDSQCNANEENRQ